MACVCGKGPSLEECCGRFLSGEAAPATAEELMRSRYAAYAVANLDYLEQTIDPDVGGFDRKNAAQWSKNATWEGMEVVETVAGGPDDDEGVVEFIARYKMDGQGVAHHERSTFRRADGKWYFRDGKMVKPKPMVRETPKVGRNDPCPCGSGMKFKKCCGA